MCWDNADWKAYRAWKGRIDTELFKQTGKHLAEVLMPNTSGERDNYRTKSGQLTSLFVDFQLDFNFKTGKITHKTTSVKKMVAKLSYELNIPIKAVKPVEKATIVELSAEEFYSRLMQDGKFEEAIV